MDRPPSLGRLYSVYFRVLLAALAAGMLYAGLALQNNWPLPEPLNSYFNESPTPRSSP